MNYNTQNKIKLSIQKQRYYFRCLTENKNKHKSTQGIKEKLKWDEHPGWKEPKRQDRRGVSGGRGLWEVG